MPTVVAEHRGNLHTEKTVFYGTLLGTGTEYKKTLFRIAKITPFGVFDEG